MNNLNANAIRTQFQRLVSIPFYKKFNRIIFSCHRYLEDNIREGRRRVWKDIIMKEYDVADASAKYPHVVRERNNIKAVFESINPRDNKRIIVTNHISGSTRGWVDRKNKIDDLNLIGEVL